MSAPLRRTPTLMSVLHVLTQSPEPLWGLAIIKKTGYPSGTIYPLLDRLENADLLTSEWEADNDRPGARRRLYHLSPTGETWAHAQLATQRQPAFRTTSQVATA